MHKLVGIHSKGVMTFTKFSHGFHCVVKEAGGRGLAYLNHEFEYDYHNIKYKGEYTYRELP